MNELFRHGENWYEVTVVNIWDCDAGRVFVRIHEHRTDQHGIDPTG